jgi:hypothetical protein
MPHAGQRSRRVEQQPTMRFSSPLKQGRIALVLIGVLSLLSCARAARSSERKNAAARSRTVVLELFTSQGCSSCPPADVLLSRLGREDFDATIIPLAYHVDYWNHLGWSDPFSSPQWSQRQNLYARALKSDQVYTPQIVINGTAGLVGSAENAIRAEIKRQLRTSDPGEVTIDRVALVGTQLEVDLHARLDAGASRTKSKLFVAVFENGVTTSVRSGENARRTLTNDAIVRWQEAVLDLSANGVEGKRSVRIPLRKEWRPERLGVAAFLQDTTSFAIHASSARRVQE